VKKRTRMLRFTPKIQERILERDGGCIFCKKHYHLESKDTLPYRTLEIMHIVNKSQGGLGIEQNGVVGCRYHHTLLDNGNKGLRSEMLLIIKKYMQSLYPNWNTEDLTYKKY
jgi:hypothetical protein